ncbi:MAG: class I SAM-dependent methyltransferase, partial [Aeromicrobium sp.]
PARSAALDFGCGAGRLTQALARRFDRADGVDIAASMIALAEEHNPDSSRAVFHLNERADLSLFEDASFDLVLSVVVLQHMNNSLKESYLREFFRVLRPGGVALFTVPSHADLSVSGLARRMPNALQNVYRRRRHGYDSVMEFYPMRRRKVEAAIARAGCTVTAVVDDPMAGPPWHSFLYVVRKP